MKNEVHKICSPSVMKRRTMRFLHIQEGDFERESNAPDSGTCWNWAILKKTSPHSFHPCVSRAKVRSNWHQAPDERLVGLNFTQAGTI